MLLVTLFGQRAVEPVPAGTGLRDEDALRACGWQPPAEWIDVTLARPDIAAGDDRGTVSLGGLGNGKSICVDSKTAGEWARLWHGCPPSVLHVAT
jgi:hypothetical protein